MKKLLILLSFLLSLNTFSQNTEDEIGIWYTYAGSHKIKGKFSLKSVAWFQFKDYADQFQNNLFRLGGNYKIRPNMSVTLGYAYVGKAKGGEHRIYDELNYSHKLQSLKIKHRLRFEHRFPKHKDMIIRLRYRLVLSQHLYKRFSAYAFDEIAYNFQEGTKFAFNRASLGIAYKASDDIKLKLGYIGQSKPKNFKNVIELGMVISH